VIVAFASKVTVRDALIDIVLINLIKKKGLLVQIFLEDGFDAFEGIALDEECSGASGFEAIWGVTFSQTHDTEAGSEALFRVGFALQDSGEELFCVGAVFFCPPDNPGRAPLQIALVALGHVLGQGGKSALAVDSLMTCDSLIFEQDLHSGGG